MKKTVIVPEVVIPEIKDFVKNKEKTNPLLHSNIKYPHQ